MTAEIVVVGSLVTDYVTRTPRFPRAGETVFGHSITIGCGGKGINQCLVAQRLGAHTAFVGKLGKDSVGDNFISALKETNINIANITRTSEGPSAVANVTVDDSGENCIVNIPGANKLLKIEDVKAAADVIKNAKVLVCQNEVTLDATKAALILARENGVTTLMNAGPAISDLDPQIIQNSDILCVNETEAEVLVGMKVDSVSSAVDAGHAMVMKGCGGALITLGAKGAVWVTQKKEDYQYVDTEKVKAVDTTGAGDAFLGALAYFIARNPSMAFKEKMKRACFVATTSVQKAGIWDSYPHRHELNQDLFK